MIKQKASFSPAATAIKKKVNPQMRVGGKVALKPGDQLNLLRTHSKVQRRKDNSLNNEKLQEQAGWRAENEFYLLCCFTPLQKLLVKVGRLMYHLNLKFWVDLKFSS